MKLLIPLLLIAILMAVTNPSMADFQAWLQPQLAQGVNGALGGATALTNGLKSLTGFDAVAWAAKNITSSATRQDYTLFSVYRLTAGGKQYTWIGVFRQFVSVDGVRQFAQGIR